MAKRFRKPLYQCWCNIKSRCYNPNTKQYERYGKRGINMCDEWKNDYSLFEKWAMENHYEKGLTIDRINNNDGYYPSNCRFVTMAENNKNKRNLIYIQINNEKQMCLKDFCKQKGLNYILILARIERGWSYKDAIFTPKKGEI